MLMIDDKHPGYRSVLVWLMSSALILVQAFVINYLYWKLYHAHNKRLHFLQCSVGAMMIRMTVACLALFARSFFTVRAHWAFGCRLMRFWGARTSQLMRTSRDCRTACAASTSPCACTRTHRYNHSAASLLGVKVPQSETVA